MGEQFDQGLVKKLPLIELLKRIGPGIILAGVVIGPGNITTSAMMGSNYGYSMIWLIIPIAFMAITFMLTSYRISMLTGMPIIHAIRHYYGKGAAAIVGIATFLACLFFTMGNITGSGAGMSLIFGMNWKLGSLIMIAITLVCYFTKGVYSTVEKVITLCILGMIVCFYATLVATGGPVWGELGKGLTNWKVAEGSLTTALAYVSTNAAITAGIYGTYLGLEKKWKKEDLFNGIMLADAIAHVVAVIMISGSILLVGAIVLNPSGTAITAPAQLGELLVPFLGKAAPVVMGVALLAAGFSSLLGNTQRGMVLLGAGIDKPVGLETKFIRWGCLLCIAFAAAISFSYNGSPTQLILIANLSTAIATPIGGFYVCRMIFRKDVNEGMKTPLFLQICMVVSYGFALVMTGSALMNIIQKFM
ncbi:Nramp family divalent metal transporter [Anaerobium acetethylicum]|uniref:NRAMP (Natural resistance-associated macrophage protein) metal ion transporters n=1 Tax=Anaerobium acetethylicum TaxID=1619234 RepID=A0A1D3TRN8_9FIRM|nr:Nramp family divalent metal transporter [Anaerobium acetethylicum]SCP96411.1 NRAMP (natural resistance-associated macrophage protein) metal ion transporters [Anaerobium acetethylicum]